MSCHVNCIICSIANFVTYRRCDDCSELETGSEGLRLHRILTHPDKPINSGNKGKNKAKNKQPKEKAIKEEAGEEKKKQKRR